MVLLNRGWREGEGKQLFVWKDKALATASTENVNTLAGMKRIHKFINQWKNLHRHLKTDSEDGTDPNMAYLKAIYIFLI